MLECFKNHVQIYISIIVDYTISQSIDCIPWNVSSVEFIFI